MVSRSNPKRQYEKMEVDCVDLSSPEGMSVNDAIEPRLCALSYCGVEDAVKEVLRPGRNTVDGKSAYQVVPVHPDDCWLLEMLEGGSRLLLEAWHLKVKDKCWLRSQ